MSSTSQPPDNPAADEPPIEYRSHYAKLARRMVGWTTNLLATTVVLVLALAGGRELISWWGLSSATESLSSASQEASDWTVPWQSCLVQFGDAPFALQRDSVSGDVDHALEQLRRRCRKVLSEQPSAPVEMGPAEAKLLAAYRDRKPVEEQPGAWRLYETRQPMPLVVGIRDDCDAHAAGENGQAANSRLVVWGMAVPESPQSWSTYTCRTAPGSSAASKSTAVPVPPGCHRTLNIADENGNMLIGFYGGDPTEAMQFYNAWAARENWRIARDWQRGGSAYSARYVPADARHDAINVQLAVDDTQTMRGLMIVSRPATPGDTDP